MEAEGLRLLLDSEEDIEVIGSVQSGSEIVSAAKELQPDIILMDIEMPDVSGIEATRQIIAEAPEIKVLGFSMHTDRHYVGEMLAAGASGYLPKNCKFDEVAEAIRVVCEGRTYLSPSIAGDVVDDYVRRIAGDKSSKSRGSLSPRERDVLRLLAEGKSTKGIADSLNLSPKTIETHRQRIMAKLDIHNIADLTKYAIRSGLTTLDVNP